MSMNINPTTSGMITLTPLTKSGKPSRIGSSTAIVMDWQEHEDGSVSYNLVSHYIVDNGVTEPYIKETHHYTPNARVRVEFTSVAEYPYLAKYFGRLYDAWEMAKSDCE